MIRLACFLLAAAATSVTLVDEVYKIPANEWRYVELGLNQRPAVVSARFDVEAGSSAVRLALMRREDLEHLRAGLPHGVFAETNAAASGSLPPQVRGPGDFVLVVDNGAETAAAVRLRVWLDFGVRAGPQVTRLSPRRQFTVILISFAVFFGIITWSARRLLRGIRRQPPAC
jgi:hypothetical protein